MGKEIYQFISYQKYIPEEFVPIKNYRFFNKPSGGLWSSPKNSKNSWEKWIKENNYRETHYREKTDFFLKDGSKILKIISYEDLKKLPKIEYPEEVINFIGRELYDTLVYPDFEKIAESYDGLFIEINSETKPFMKGWDVDSLLIFNKDIILPIENWYFK